MSSTQKCRKRVNWPISKGRRVYKDISDHLWPWSQNKMGNRTNHRERKNKSSKKKIKKKSNKKRQVPRVRISILTGTAFAVQCSTHWAAGNLPWKESKILRLYVTGGQSTAINKGKGSKESVLWLQDDGSIKPLWFNVIMFKFISVSMHVVNLRV